MISKYFVLLVTIGAVAAQQPVPVTIYYETLCPDSMAFFTKQIIPTWRDLKEHINLKLVPFGKSTSTPGIPPQNRTFTCHHGANECLGNKFQSCLLSPTYSVTLENQIKFIDCLMVDANREKNYEERANGCKSSAPSVDVTILNHCAKSELGDGLLYQNQLLTNAVQNPLTSVPTIVFNNHFDQTKSKEAEKSFRSALCSQITNPTKPKACESSGAGPITTVGLITLLTAGLAIHLL